MIRVVKSTGLQPPALPGILFVNDRWTNATSGRARGLTGELHVGKLMVLLAAIEIALADFLQRLERRLGLVVGIE
jgi:hypothetical protein